MNRTTVIPPKGREPFNVRCTGLGCGHRWTVGFLPMPMGIFAKVLRSARCPSCGATSRKIRVDTGE